MAVTPGARLALQAAGPPLQLTAHPQSEVLTKQQGGAAHGAGTRLDIHPCWPLAGASNDELAAPCNPSRQMIFRYPWSLLQLAMIRQVLIRAVVPRIFLQEMRKCRHQNIPLKERSRVYGARL